MSSNILAEIYEHLSLISEVLPNNYLSIKYRTMGGKQENNIAISYTVLSNYLKYGGTGQLPYLSSVTPLFDTFLSEFSVMNNIGTFIVNMIPCEVRFFSFGYFKLIV